MNSKDWTATGKLLWFYLRQNKILFILIILLPFLLAYGTAVSNMRVLTTADELHQYIEQSTSNPVSVGMLGPILSDTLVGVTSWRIRLTSALFAAVLSIIMIIKHTRKEEELGRLELVRSGVVGSKAPLTAALMKTFAANIIGGLLMAVGFVAAGFPVVGSLVAGLATALCGSFFTAVAGLAAQVTPSARTANVISYALLVFFILFNVIANFQSELSGIFYLSPFSWATIARPYAGNNVSVFVIAILVIALIIIGTYGLLATRDIGAGLIAEKSGRTNAKPGFNNPFALSWRLQGSMAFIWVVGYAVIGALIGSLVVTIGSMFQDGSALTGWITGMGGTGRAFLYFLIYILIEVVSAYAIIATLRLRSEEDEMRAEPILANSVSRVKWAISHLLFTFVGTAIIVAAMGMGAGITASVVLRDSGEFINVFSACIAKIPAVWFVASITVLLFGWLPKFAAGISWTLMGIFLAIEFLWELKVIGNDVFRLSPFSYVYPTGEIMAAPIIMLTLLAVTLTSAGIWGLKRREIGH